MENINITNPNYAVKSLDELVGSAKDAKNAVRILDNQLLTLRLNLGKLRVALESAFAPITATLTPVLNAAVTRLTSFCQDAGSVIAALFGTVYKKSVTTARKTGSALKRTLASFDQINRLQGGSGGSGETVTTLEPVNDALTPELALVVARIRELMSKIRTCLAPLKDINFSTAISALGRLGGAFVSLGETLGSALSWAWFHLLTPLATWVVETAAPASVDLLRSAIDLLTAALGPVMAGFASLKPALTPAANFLKDTFTVIVNALRTRFETMTQAISQRSAQIAQIFQNIGTAFSGLWEKAQPHLENLRTLFLQIMGGIADAAATWVGHLMDSFEGLTGFLAGAFTGSWSQAWDGLKLALRSAVNGIIGLLNSLLSGLAAGLNLVSSSLNKWQVEVPQWVPKVGGKTFGFSLPAITAPQIPYLAQGAVLPANKPFLAVVGDQKHGTNIEAPLSTIQEAVAMTMEDFAGGNMAGHAATVAALEELLRVVRNIRLGDDDIAAACRRSQSRRAVMKGGGYAL